MSDHTQADAGRERDPIPTARESDQDRQALSAPWTSPPAPTRTRPPAPPPCRAAPPACAWTLGASAAPTAWIPCASVSWKRWSDAPLRMPAPPARCWTSAWPPCSTPTRRTWSGTRPRPAAPRPSRRKRLAARRRIAPPPIRPSTPLPADTLASLARALDTGHAVPWRGAYPELPLLDVYRDIWAKVSANRQLRQSEQQVPDNAGPLNSNNLVHRSLALMRQLARLSAPVPVLPGRAGLDGAVRWRGGRCQGSRARFGQGWRQGCGQGG